MMPSAYDLHYFVEVAGTRNISRAAERLGISQPSLTLAVRRLEESVGVPLLIRSKQGVALTQSGKQLLSQARSLLQTWESMRSKARESQSQVSGTYSIGCHVSVALYCLPGFLPSLLQSFPKLEIGLIHDLSRKIAEEVISMKLDFGLVINPVKHPDLIVKKLCDDEVTLWVGPGDSPVQDPHSGEGVLICDPALLQTQDLLRRLERSSICYKRVLGSSSLEVVSQLTAHGAGIGILPGRVAARETVSRLRKVAKAPAFKDELCLIYRVEHREVRTIQELVKKISQQFAKN